MKWAIAIQKLRIVKTKRKFTRMLILRGRHLYPLSLGRSRALIRNLSVREAHTNSKNSHRSSVGKFKIRAPDLLLKIWIKVKFKTRGDIKVKIEIYPDLTLMIILTTNPKKHADPSDPNHIKTLKSNTKKRRMRNFSQVGNLARSNSQETHNRQKK